MEEKESYLSPSTKVIEVMGNETICAASGNTEAYGVGGYSYGEDDWD